MLRRAGVVVETSLLTFPILITRLLKDFVLNISARRTRPSATVSFDNHVRYQMIIVKGGRLSGRRYRECITNASSKRRTCGTENNSVLAVTAASQSLPIEMLFEKRRKGANPHGNVARAKLIARITVTRLRYVLETEIAYL